MEELSRPWPCLTATWSSYACLQPNKAPGASFTWERCCHFSTPRITSPPSPGPTCRPPEKYQHFRIPDTSPDNTPKQYGNTSISVRPNRTVTPPEIPAFPYSQTCHEHPPPHHTNHSQKPRPPSPLPRLQKNTRPKPRTHKTTKPKTTHDSNHTPQNQHERQTDRSKFFTNTLDEPVDYLHTIS